MLAENETVILYSATSRIQDDDGEGSLLNRSLNAIFVSDEQRFTLYTSELNHYEKIQSAVLSGSQLYVVVHQLEGYESATSSVLIHSHRNGSIISKMTFDRYGKFDIELRSREIHALIQYLLLNIRSFV